MRNEVLTYFVYNVWFCQKKKSVNVFDPYVIFFLFAIFSITTSTAMGDGVKKVKKVSNGSSPEERESMAWCEMYFLGLHLVSDTCLLSEGTEYYIPTLPELGW